MLKNRSTTPCLGICSTTYGDDVCKGCKRFVHEIINWPKYSMDERAIVNDRLEEFKLLILKERFKVVDKDLFALKLKENAINYNNSLDPLTWIFDLLRASGSQNLDLAQFGITSLQNFDFKTIKDELNNEMLELSKAHHERYFKNLS
ncbi:DUF1289 domain-containing protein [Gammaproteobacteria bacterium]|jgi:predicted Fe-S protein YdhL (DUF1289 family)|nr:DUF1289 domain-containing protein [Gammaproteobacteria bacterium]MDA7845180.1 DUF1289 domain-containing protein [Gammaproteobacteria bacterium]MDA8955838.1 DUF1289 domain-containing protein [Gammaproteobacteria bacterium]MDA9039788.1 DUF1289 domain-containing protein [Gammaproteobacteria bacterium]MDA9101952.1 DUF1289 domain-containing protein [Gammaproteobacteria bacterium]|tara:strand:+ start:2520 stop:2960 length:441 start_codon:yes stop_codon:yes gene_type:complete